MEADTRRGARRGEGTTPGREHGATVVGLCAHWGILTDEGGRQRGGLPSSKMGLLLKAGADHVLRMHGEGSRPKSDTHQKAQHNLGALASVGGPCSPSHRHTGHFSAPETWQVLPTSGPLHTPILLFLTAKA